VRLVASTKPHVHQKFEIFWTNTASTMAYPNFRNRPKKGLGPLGVNGYKYTHIWIQICIACIYTYKYKYKYISIDTIYGGNIWIVYDVVYEEYMRQGDNQG
jgi:hypothetical protein